MVGRAADQASLQAALCCAHAAHMDGRSTLAPAGGYIARCPHPAEAGKLEGVHISASLDSALRLLSSPEYQQKVESVFVIGGGQVCFCWGCWVG